MKLVRVSSTPSAELFTKMIECIDGGLLSGRVTILCEDPVKTSFVATVLAHQPHAIEQIAVVDRDVPSEAVVIHAHNGVLEGSRVSVPSNADTIVL